MGERYTARPIHTKRLQLAPTGRHGAPAGTLSAMPPATPQEPAGTLGAFLQERRLRLQPEDVGIRRPGPRGRRGLRRSEVAELADISLAYYTFIERGRDVRPSAAVLDSIAVALQLTAGERRQLHGLRVGEVRRPRAVLAEIGEEVEELAEVLEPNPCYVMGARWDLLYWNRAAELLFANWHQRSRRERNMLWFYLCDPAARRLYVDWETEAANQVAHFRESYAQYGHDPSFMRLLESIFEITPQARDWWERHDTTPSRSGLKRVRLDPEASDREVVLQQLVLEVADNPEIQVVTYFAGRDEPDDDTD